MGADPVEFLTAALARVEETARAATKGPWWAEDTSPRRWGEERDAQVATSKGLLAVLPYDKNGALNADHIALHDPESVLRLVAGARALLADLQAERHLVVDGDCWFTCTAATEERDGGENCDDDRRGQPCDCGRDARVERRVRLLAQAWGWPGT